MDFYEMMLDFRERCGELLLVSDIEKKNGSGEQVWKTLRLLICILGVIAMLWMLFYRPVQSVAEKAERQLDKVLEALTGQKTTIKAGKGILESTDEIAELSLLELKMNTVRSLENESFVAKYVSLGTKRLELQGVFNVKVGYNLAQGCEISETENERFVVKFPKPEVLSVELIELRTLHEEEGWLNKVTPEDRDALVNELREQMRQEAEESGLLQISESQMKMRLIDLLGVKGESIQWFDAM